MLTTYPVISRVRSPVPIEILQSQRYSIGETAGGPLGDDEDGEAADDPPMMPVLWVSGQGGWFEIHPAPEYVPIYREICSAIKLFYTIYDIYCKADSDFVKAKSSSTEPLERLAPLFLKYAVRVGSGITVQEVAQRCHDIAPFLIGQFQDDLSFWKKTYFYEWLKKENEVPYFPNAGFI